MSDYPAEHQAVRRAWSSYVVAGTVCCWRCGDPIRPGAKWDLGHDDEHPGVYRGPEHPACNRRAGAIKGNTRRRKRKRGVQMSVCVLAVEVAERRDHTSIVAAGRLDGYITIELASYLSGTAGATAEVARLCAERSVQATVVDPHSNASNLVKPLRDAGATVITPSTADVQSAHGGFIDLVRSRGLRHVAHPVLDEAIREATERRLGGAAAWERRNTTVDLSPATASDLAVWGLSNLPPPPSEPWISWGEPGEPERRVGPPDSASVGAMPGMAPRGPLAPPPTPRGLPNVRR